MSPWHDCVSVCVCVCCSIPGGPSPDDLLVTTAKTFWKVCFCGHSRACRLKCLSNILRSSAGRNRLTSQLPHASHTCPQDSSGHVALVPCTCINLTYHHHMTQTWRQGLCVGVAMQHIIRKALTVSVHICPGIRAAINRTTSHLPADHSLSTDSISL